MNNSYKILCLIYILVLACFSSNAQETNKKAAKIIRSFQDNENEYNNKHPGTIKPGYKEFKVGNKTIVIYGTDHSVRNVDAKQFVEMEDQINKLAPTLILTEAYYPALHDKKQTALQYGESGFCKYIANQKGIEIDNWDERYGHIYYELLKKFKPDDIYVTLLSYIFNTYHPNPGERFESLYNLIAINAFENGGYPLTDQQRQVDYFYARFAKHMQLAYKEMPDSANFAHIQKILQRGVYKKIISKFLQLRDLNLLKTIRQNLNKHDRIFIQCGYAHRASMEKVIQNILSLNYPVSGDSIKQVLQKQIQPGDTLALNDEAYVKEFKVGSKKIVIWGTRSKHDFLDDSVVSKMKKRIKDLSPSILLISNFKPVESTESKMYKRYGEAGLSRFSGQENKAVVNVWSKYWSYANYELCRKYSSDRVFYAVLFYNMDKYKNAYKNNFYTFQQYFEDVASQLMFEGYPWRYNETDLYVLYDHCRKDIPGLPDADRGIIDNIAYAINCPQLAPIIADLKKYKTEELFLAIQEAIGKNDRIFVQTDWDYVKELYN